MNPSIKSIVPIVAACALALVACGGGGGGGGSQLSLLPEANHDRIRALTGSTAPPATETDAAIAARVANIVSQADSLVLSSVRVEVPQHVDLREPSSCRGRTCSYSTDGILRSISTDDLEVVSSTRRGIVLHKSGITLGEGGVDGTETSFGLRYNYVREAYGAWMRHAGFAVYGDNGRLIAPEGNTIVILGQDTGSRSVGVTERYTGVVGDLTGSAPTEVAASWTGVMVGTPETGATKGNLLQGDATLTYTISGGSAELDAAFTDIKNLDRVAAHSVPTVNFNNIPVRVDGTFNVGFSGNRNRIQGGFYGPGHAEAAGVFEYSNILGAFGAKRR